MFKKSILFLSLTLFFLPGFSLEARGRDERNYRDVMSAAFEQIILKMESGSLSGKEGKACLEEARSELRPGYTDFDGMLDALIDSVSEGQISSDEALALLRERVAPGPAAGNFPESGSGQERAERDEESGSDGSRHGGAGGPSDSKPDNSGKGKNGS